MGIYICPDARAYRARPGASELFVDVSSEAVPLLSPAAPKAARRNCRLCVALAQFGVPCW